MIFQLNKNHKDMKKNQAPRVSKKGVFLPLPVVYELMETALKLEEQNYKKELTALLKKAIEEKGSDGSPFWIILKASTSGIEDLKTLEGMEKVAGQIAPQIGASDSETREILLRTYVMPATFMLRLWTARAFLTGTLADEVAVSASDVEDMLLSEAPLIIPEQ